MRKTKLNDRIENAVNAFFEPGPDSSRVELTYTPSDSAFLAVQRPLTEKADKWISALREVFLFGPGAFALFYMTLTVAFFYPTIGISAQGFLMLCFPAFLTYAGIGKINNFRNLAVPATVIAMGLLFALVAPLLFGRELADLYFWDSIYLLPFVLVVAKLVQYWMADK